MSSELVTRLKQRKVFVLQKEKDFELFLWILTQITTLLAQRLKEKLCFPFICPQQ